MSDDTWRYFPGTSEPPSNWSASGFNDSGWLQGKGGIGYGDGDDLTVIDPVGSVFMRIQFDIPEKDVIAGMMLNVDFDDGFVAYLNNHEIARANIGTVGIRPPYSEYAILTSFEARMPAGGSPAQFIISMDSVSRYLAEGNNVLALQVHNCNATSSDLSSTTFLSVAISSENTYFRPVPAWFIDPFNQTSHMPVIVIDTYGQYIPDEPKIMASCKVIDHGPGILNNISDAGTDYEGQIGIEVRGQSSQMFPKKSFAIELRKDAVIDSAVSLLGMPANEDWILYAHYSDKSMLRNAITFYLGGKMGVWQPRFRFCVVYINGEYNGIYLLMENIKKGEERVDISTLRPEDIAGAEVTGGYIVKVDKTWNLTQDEYFTTYPSYVIPNSRNYNFTYVYPEADQIKAQQKSYIKAFLTDFETTLNSSGFMNPDGGFRKYIDYGSFADFQIMQELSNNVDGYRYSTFFHKHKDTRGGKLVAGPLWDFDLCYGNVDYSPINLSTSGWLYPYYGPNEGYPMHWWARLMGDPEYVRRFVLRWRDLRKGPFSTDSIMYFIDSTVEYLGSEVAKNFTRWPILGTYVWPNYFVGNTYTEEIDYFKGWIEARLQWMDQATSESSELFKSSFTGGITVFPVPVDREVSVVFNLSSTLEYRIEIIDMTGRLFFRKEYLPETGGYQDVTLNLNDLGTGYYILRVMQGNRLIGNRKLFKY